MELSTTMGDADSSTILVVSDMATGEATLFDEHNPSRTFSGQALAIECSTMQKPDELIKHEYMMAPTTAQALCAMMFTELPETQRRMLISYWTEQGKMP